MGVLVLKSREGPRNELVFGDVVCRRSLEISSFLTDVIAKGSWNILSEKFVFRRELTSLLNDDF